MLGATKSDLALDMLLVAIGAALGTFPQACASMVGYFTDPAAELTLLNFITVIFFWVGMALALGMGTVHLRRNTNRSDLVAKIRNRTLKVAE